MNTQEAYEQAVKELCSAVNRKDFETVSWIAHTIEILGERIKQEAIAVSMDAFHPHQTIKLVNSDRFTRQVIQQMKDDPTHYGYLYQSRALLDERVT